MRKKIHLYLSDLFEFLSDSYRLVLGIPLFLCFAYLLYLSMYAIPMESYKAIAQSQIAQDSVSAGAKTPESIVAASPQQSAEDAKSIPNKIEPPVSFLRILAKSVIFAVITLGTSAIVVAIGYSVLYSINCIYGAIFCRAKKSQKHSPTSPASVRISKKKVPIRQYKTITRRRTYTRKR